jgi:hypothetical protein
MRLRRVCSFCRPPTRSLGRPRCSRRPRRWSHEAASWPRRRVREPTKSPELAACSTAPVGLKSSASMRNGHGSISTLPCSAAPPGPSVRAGIRFQTASTSGPRTQTQRASERIEGAAYRVAHARENPKPLPADPREGSGPRQELTCPGPEAVPLGRHLGDGDTRARTRLVGDGVQREQGLADPPGAARRQLVQRRRRAFAHDPPFLVDEFGELRRIALYPGAPAGAGVGNRKAPIRRFRGRPAGAVRRGDSEPLRLRAVDEHVGEREEIRGPFQQLVAKLAPREVVPQRPCDRGPARRIEGASPQRPLPHSTPPRIRLCTTRRVVATHGNGFGSSLGFRADLISNRLPAVATHRAPERLCVV